MQAIFRPSPDLEIVVTTEPSGVLVEVLQGTHPHNYPPDTKLDPPIVDGWGMSAPAEAGKAYERRVTGIRLSNSDARSIASAMMGAAKR